MRLLSGCSAQNTWPHPWVAQRAKFEWLYRMEHISRVFSIAKRHSRILFLVDEITMWQSLTSIQSRKYCRWNFCRASLPLSNSRINSSPKKLSHFVSMHLISGEKENKKEIKCIHILITEGVVRSINWLIDRLIRISLAVGNKIPGTNISHQNLFRRQSVPRDMNSNKRSKICGRMRSPSSRHLTQSASTLRIATKISPRTNNSKIPKSPDARIRKMKREWGTYILSRVRRFVRVVWNGIGAAQRRRDD